MLSRWAHRAANREALSGISPARKLICRFMIEISTLAAPANLGVSTGYACDSAPCNRTNLNKERAKQLFNRLVSAWG